MSHARGRPPYGWAWSKTDGGDAVLVEVEDEQRAIALAVRLYAGRRSLRVIAAALVNHGYRNRAGGRWNPNQVKRILDAERERRRGGA